MGKRGKRTKSQFYLRFDDFPSLCVDSVNFSFNSCHFQTVNFSFSIPATCVVSGYFLVAERRGNGIKSLIFFFFIF